LISAGRPVLGVVHAPVLNVSYWGVAGQGAFKREAGESKQLAVSEDTSPLRVVASRSRGS
jgi:3'(2'), 5'-bisphosphate nucleotidase